MKLTKTTLQKIIKEELESIIDEAPATPDVDPEVIAAVAADLEKNPEVMAAIRKAAQDPKAKAIANELKPDGTSEKPMALEMTAAQKKNTGLGQSMAMTGMGSLAGLATIILQAPHLAASLWGIAGATGGPLSVLTGASTVVAFAAAALLAREAIKN